MKINIEKEQLYSIMNNLVDIQFHMDAFTTLLKGAEKTYNQENKQELILITGVVIKYLESLNIDLNEESTKLDELIIHS